MAHYLPYESVETVSTSSAPPRAAPESSASPGPALPIARVKRALKQSGDGRAALVLDLACVRRSARRFMAAMPTVRPHYAVKANPDRRVLEVLAQEGAGFEIASPSELDLLLSIGVAAGEIFYSNPVRSPQAIQYAAKKGVEWFVFDCADELDKFARIKPDAKLYLRIETTNEGSDWPLSGKFGASARDVECIIDRARDLKLDIAGVTFHVGSQCRNPKNWNTAMAAARETFAKLADAGFRPRLLDIGGGFPVPLTKPIPSIEAVAGIVNGELESFGPDVHVIAEPGRFLVAEAGCFVTHVIGTAMRNGRRWLHCDAGVFGGLFETTDGLRYPLFTDRRGAPVAWHVAGPTCDSVDVCLRDEMLPQDLAVGDAIYVVNSGAYTTAYASEFNGFALPQLVVIDSDREAV
jgi:ornithine decarboxylase